MLVRRQEQLCVCVHVHVYMYSRVQSQVSSSLTQHHSLRQGFSLNLELTDSPRLGNPEVAEPLKYFKGQFELENKNTNLNSC